MNAVVEKKTGAKKVLSTMGGKPSPCSEATCQPCHRVDLQLLIVTPSVVPSMHVSTLADAGYKWNGAFDHEFYAMKREATAPVARLAREGYLYLYYDTRLCWDVWQVMKNGLTRQIVYQASSAQCSKRLAEFIGAAAPKGCSQGAKNLSGHTVCVEGAHAIDKIWFAYSPEIWPLKVLENYATNPKIKIPGSNGQVAEVALRDLRGRELHVSAIVQGSVAPGCIPLTAENLSAYVVDFVDKANPKYVDLFAQAVEPLDLDRVGQAGALAKRVRAIEKAGGAAKDPDRYLNKSVIVMLSDDIGVAEDHNQLRLLGKELREKWALGGPDITGGNDDPLRPWKLRSSLHIDTIENWVFSKELALQKGIDSNGGYRHTSVISGDEYRLRMIQEKKNGRPYEPGATYEKLPGPVDRYKVTRSKEEIERGLEGIAMSNAKGRIDRYRGKLRYNALSQFKQAFKSGMDAWEAHITALDTDYVSWINQGRLRATARYDFDNEISFIKLDTTHGTAEQQVDAWLARVRAQDKIWGGGALTPVSARELAKAHGKDPNAPAKWIDDSLLAPFTAGKVLREAGEQKEIAEKLNLIIRELPEQIKHILHLRHQAHAAHGSHVAGLTKVSQQAAALNASLVDASHAKGLGLSTISVAEAKQTLNFGVRTTALMALATEPWGDRYVTIGAKVPPGEAIDKMVTAFTSGELEVELEAQSDTTRKTRNKSASRMRRLSKSPGLIQPEFQTIAVTEKTLSKLESQAIKNGEELVEVIAADPLGVKLPSKFKLPKSTALNLISEQASSAKAAWKTAASGGGVVASLIGILQVRALFDVLDKLDNVEGHEHADLMYSAFCCAAGLVETTSTLAASYYGLRTGGGKLMLSSVASSAANFRFAAGVAGAAGALFTALSMYAKYKSAKERGSWDAMQMYGISSAFFWGSTFSLGAGAILNFVSSTTTRYAVSRVIVSSLGRTAAVGVFGEVSGLALGFGVLGILLTVAGFGLYLYALSLEDDLNEIFLKRTFWGKYDPPRFLQSDANAAANRLLPYGIFERPTKARGALEANLDVQPGNAKGSDAEAFLLWSARGTQEETHGFDALSVGLKSTLAWADEKWLLATVESVRGGEGWRLSYDLLLQGTDGKTLLETKSAHAELEFEREEHRYVFKIQLPTVVFWKQVGWGSFAYKLYSDEEPDVPFAEDELQVKKPA